jgi:glyoxylase-like metal-dependent hydrolase (beta-lactamase superfamily II)
MVLHHLNCGTLRPPAARLVNGEGVLLARGRIVCHCLLLETASDGLILVDTGLGTQPLPASARAFLSPDSGHGETALEQVRGLGHRPEDVRNVVLTHLDIDHAGGLRDFPRAKVHLHRLEHQAAHRRLTALERTRYHAAQWAHGPDWALYQDEGEAWFGFHAVRPLTGISHEIALIPLFGHTRGHTGVAIKDGDRWTLHAGDAYYHRDQLAAKPSCPLGLEAFQRLMATDDQERRANAERLGAFHRERGDVDLFCAHDPVELDRARRAQ